MPMQENQPCPPPVGSGVGTELPYDMLEIVTGNSIVREESEKPDKVQSQDQDKERD